MPTSYRMAPEVRTIAQRLIQDRHRRLEGLGIRYFFRDTAAEKGGVPVWGVAGKSGGRSAFLASNPDPEGVTWASPSFAWLEVPFDVWKRLTDHQKEALIDEKLGQIMLGESGPVIAPLEVAANGSNIARYGAWRDDVERFLKVATAQQTLALDTDDAILVESSSDGLAVTIGGQRHLLNEAQMSILSHLLQREKLQRLKTEGDELLAEMDARAAAREAGMQLTDYGRAEVEKQARTCAQCGGINGPGNRAVEFSRHETLCDTCAPQAEERATAAARGIPSRAARTKKTPGVTAHLEYNGQRAEMGTPAADALVRDFVGSVVNGNGHGTAVATIPPPSLIEAWRSVATKAAADTMLLVRHPGEDWWFFDVDAVNAAELMDVKGDVIWGVGGKDQPVLCVPQATYTVTLQLLENAGCQVESHELAPAEEAAVA